jgi:hypothetical protein
MAWNSRGRLIKLVGRHSHPRGAIAQLGERIVRNDEVVGSIPTSSTNFSMHRSPPLTQDSGIRFTQGSQPINGRRASFHFL